MSDCKHWTLDYVRPGVYGCLECGWLPDNVVQERPGRRAVVIQQGTPIYIGPQRGIVSAPHPGESWQVDDDNVAS